MRVVSGLSPRMRGNRGNFFTLHSQRGSIPAHAGEPQWGSYNPDDSKVYPRACGGTPP